MNSKVLEENQEQKTTAYKNHACYLQHAQAGDAEIENSETYEKYSVWYSEEL